MPAFHNPAKVLLQLNERCRDLTWLKERPRHLAAHGTEGALTWLE